MEGRAEHCRPSAPIPSPAFCAGFVFTSDPSPSAAQSYDPRCNPGGNPHGTRGNTDLKGRVVEVKRWLVRILQRHLRPGDLELEVVAEASAEAQPRGPVSQLSGAAPHSPAFPKQTVQNRAKVQHKAEGQRYAGEGKHQPSRFFGAVSSSYPHPP